MAKEIHKRISVWLNQQGIENNLKSVRAAINKTANELAKLPIGTEEWYRKSEKLQKLKDIQAELRKETELTTKAVEKHNEKINDTLVNIGAVSTIYNTASAAVQRFVSATQEYIDAYVKVDDAMQAVVKSSGLARGEIEDLRESFAGFDTRTSTGELLKIAEVGGHLGLTKDQLRDFVQYTDQAMQTIGMSAEEVANAFSKIQRTFSDVSGQDISTTIQQAGSAMNALDKVTTSTEANIMAFTEAVGKMSDGIKPSLADTLALGAAFESAGLDAQQAATGYARILTTARADIGKFTSVMGQTEEQLRNLINTKPAEFLLEFAESLKGLPTAEQGEKLKELGLNSQRLDSTIGALTKNTQEFRTALQLSAEEYGKASAMTENYNALNSTAAAQLEKAKKAVEDAKAALGEELLPVITELTQASAGGIKVVTTVVKFWTQHKTLLISLVGAYALLKAVQKAVIALQKEEQAVTLSNTAAGKAYTLVTKLLAAAKAKLAADTEAAAAAQAELKAAFATTPWGAIITAVTALVTGVGMLVSKHREAKKAAEEFNTEVAKEQAEAQYLFEKLKNTEKGTDDYREALEKLKEKYPEIIQKHLDEEGALRDVEQAYKDVIVQIKAKIAEQLKEEKRNKIVTDALNTQTDAIDELRKKLQRKGKSESFINDFIGDVQKMVNAGATYEQLAKKMNSAGLKTKALDEGIYRKGSTEDIAHLLSKSQKDMTESLEQLDKKYDPIIEDANEELKIQKQLDELYAKREKFDPFGSYGNGNQSPFVVGIDKQIDQLLDKLAKVQEAKKAVAEKPADSPDDPPKPPSGGGNSNKSDMTLTARENFQKKLQQMEAKAQADTLSGWEKTKQEIVNKYDELLAEAKELYGEDSKTFAKVQQMKVDAIAAAGQQYLQKQGKTLEDFSQKIQDWVKETAPEEGNEILNAVLGTEQKWAQRFTDAQSQLQTLMELRAQFVADNQDTAALDALIDKLGTEMNRMADAEAADVQKTLEKYRTGIDDFIKSEQKSVTDATLSETERQKSAIREKYELEIQLIEKLKAARKAEEGDDADVSDLEAKIKELKELLDKQLGNVDKASASSGSKSVWQQLAEFDWSKLRDNWQSALDLMAQGLREFADTAADIYGSIAQIQDNRMEAELQRTQEAYDAETAALQRQLNQGVISQKAYDAKMQKLNEEKEKKEKKLKHEQFEREKTANIIKAVVDGALAIANVWKDNAGMPVLAAALTAVAAAVNAAQIAAIASQPNPYAKGGYIRGRQYAVMGEQGDEWVASNRLLKDRESAAVIAALDDYQRGDALALKGLAFAAPDTKTLSQALPQNGRTFAPSNQTTNNYYQNSDNSELLKEIRQMNEYLRDPKNRQATINRNILLEYERLENSVREMARL